MARLAKKVKLEMKPGSIIISNSFKMPDLKVIKEKNNVRVYQV